jgi:hypothetical protein
MKNIDGNNLTHVKNFAGMEFDDEECKNLNNDIKSTLLCNPEQYPGFTAEAIVTVLDVYNDPNSNTYNVIGIIQEGENFKYFMLDRKYANVEERIAARNALKTCGGEGNGVPGYNLVADQKMNEYLWNNMVNGKTYSPNVAYILSVPVYTPDEPAPTK